MEDSSMVFQMPKEITNMHQKKFNYNIFRIFDLILYFNYREFG